MSNPGDLLDAVGKLRWALEHPGAYPDRPGKTCITLADDTLADDRERFIRDTFSHAIRYRHDELPPGVEMKLSDLLDDLHNLRWRAIEDPNGLHRRALNWVREIEEAIFSFSPKSTPAGTRGSDEGKPADAFAARPAGPRP